MNFIRKLFGLDKKEEIFDANSETDFETYIKTDENAYIFNKDKLPSYTYSDLSKDEYNAIEMSINFLNDGFGPLFQFDKEPSNHPDNLDEYLMLWGSSGYNRFMGMEQDQHIALLSYNFGDYLVKNYGMKWQLKSDGYGEQRVVRMESPIEIELYPIDSTLRAIQNKERAIYQAIEIKLINAIKMIEESKS